MPRRRMRTPLTQIQRQVHLCHSPPKGLQKEMIVCSTVAALLLAANYWRAQKQSHWLSKEGLRLGQSLRSSLFRRKAGPQHD